MKMDCHTLLERMDGVRNGTLTGDERRAAEEHLAGCADCRAALRVEPPADLTETILARTTGRTCDSAHRRLCDYVDRLLEPLDGELVGRHIDTCRECAGLTRTLERMALDLPSLAELQPDERFVGDVLARTSAPRVERLDWAARISEIWEQLVRRPRFALEGAYIGTFVLVLLIGIPSSPLAGVADKALRLTNVNPVVELREPMVRVETEVADRVSHAWSSGASTVVGASRQVADDVGRFSEDTFNTVTGRIGTFWDQLASDQEQSDQSQDQQTSDRPVSDPQSNDGD
jgi:hypothetical protein